jgi:hypothetical protein
MLIRSRRCLAVFCLLITSAVHFVCAQTGPPKYDVAAEAKFKVTVQDMKLPAKGNEKDVAHLLVKSGDDSIDIYLCPKSFLDDIGATFAKGDEITVTGSKIKQDGGDLVLAREVVKGSVTMMFR